MGDGERGKDEWRYWYNIALRRIGDSPEPNQALVELAAERSYYGFLAADEFGLEYALDDTEFQADEIVVAELSRRPALIRAHELFLVGLDGPPRSNWTEVD